HHLARQNRGEQAHVRQRPPLPGEPDLTERVALDLRDGQALLDRALHHPEGHSTGMGETNDPHAANLLGRAHPDAVGREMSRISRSSRVARSAGSGAEAGPGRSAGLPRPGGSIESVTRDVLTGPRVWPEAVWRARRAAHEARVDGWLRPHLARRRAGARH